jgi:flagellar biosynthesis protein
MKDTASPALAVALSYDGTGAPRVVAKGAGEVGERIRSTALEHGVPLQEDAELAQLLARLELDEEIPRALYVAVAQVLAFAWSVTGKLPPSGDDRHGRGSVVDGRVGQ